MKYAVLAIVLHAPPLVLSEPCFGQDALAKHKISGLKGLRTLAIVVRPNMPREIASVKEWGDMVEVGLSREVPELNRSDAPTTPAWLELNVITSDAGGFLELSVYRWVKVLDSGEEMFSKSVVGF